MKLRPDTPMQQVETVSSLSKLIRDLKRTLKQSERDPFMFSEDEIHYIKKSLRDLYARRTELNRGNGFGN